MTDRGPPRDYRAEVTQKVIDLMESGAAPWQQPWSSDSPLRVPMNPTTGKSYRGGNVLNLMIEAMSRGYDDNRWCTYKQCQAKGWQVRKGEKGTQIEFWEVRPGKGEDDTDDGKPHTRLVHRTFTVFNAAQIDGIPEIKTEPRKSFEVIEAGERILKDSGADIRWGGNRAFYRPSDDHIQMPPREAFVDPPAMYATAAHELGHWTGAPSRLNRQFGKFGDSAYAREEIRATLASLYICAETGIPFQPEQEASYLKSWAAVLKDDKNEFFKAASDAAAIADYLLGKTKEKPVATPPDEPTETPSHVERVSESRDQAQRQR